MGHVGRARRHLDHLDLGQLVTNRRAFVVAVVDEDERVQAELELMRQRDQVVRLGQPIHPAGGEMLVAQQLVRMLTQHLIDIGGVVLAAHRQDQAALLEIQDAALEFEVGVAGIVRADGDAVDAVFADDAAPQGVVRVQHQHLGLGRGQQLADHRDAPRKLHRCDRRKREPGREPVAAVKEILAADCRHDLVQIQQQRCRAGLAHPGRQLGLELRPPS